MTSKTPPNFKGLRVLRDYHKDLPSEKNIILLETNSWKHLKDCVCVWKTILSLYPPLFSGALAVAFREGRKGILRNISNAPCREYLPIKPNVGRWSIHGAYGHLENKSKYGKLSKNLRFYFPFFWVYLQHSLCENMSFQMFKKLFGKQLSQLRGRGGSCSNGDTKTIPRGKCCWYGMLPQWTT